VPTDSRSDQRVQIPRYNCDE